MVSGVGFDAPVVTESKDDTAEEEPIMAALTPAVKKEAEELFARVEVCCGPSCVVSGAEVQPLGMWIGSAGMEEGDSPWTAVSLHSVVCV